MGKWRALVLILVHVAIGLHIAHWLTAGETITPVEPSEAMAFSQGSIVNAGLVFFAVTILSTAIFGRFFCGWGCHLVALQDFCRYLMLKVGITPRPFKSRVLLFVPMLAFVYMFLWPLIYRLYIGDSLAVRGTEWKTSHFWATFPGWVVGGLTFLVCGFVCVYFLGAKGFCTYACPYGAIFAAADKLAPMRIRVTDACESCGHCSAVCSSNVQVHREVRDFGMVVSPGCMKCGDCISVCPKNALYYGVGPIPWLAKPRGERSTQPPAAIRWGEEGLLAVSFVISFLIVRGLYGLVPFLMSLGVGAVVAYLTLTTVRLFRQNELDRSGLRLKRAGKLLPWGRVYLAAMGLLFLFLAHSAVVRFYSYRGDTAFAATAGVRKAWLGSASAPALLAEPLRENIRDGINHWQMVERWGLFRSLGLATKLAWLEALAGNSTAAETRARQAIDAFEPAGEMYQILARLAVGRGDSGAALAAWNSAIDAAPDRPEAYLALGIFLAQNGDLAAGQSSFDRGLKAVPDAPTLFYNAGLARALQGRTEESLPLFERALQLEPLYREARENLAGALASLGRFEESLEHYRQAITQAPEDHATRILLSRVLIALGRSGEAAEELRKVPPGDALTQEAESLLGDLASSRPEVP